MGRGGQAPDPEQIFANWDTNGDGMISREEFDNRQPPGGGMGGGG
jgi:Ca2+-binding EF-hand superfamily protein